MTGHLLDQVQWNDGVWVATCGCGWESAPNTQQCISVKAWSQHADEMAVFALWDEELVNHD